MNLLRPTPDRLTKHLLPLKYIDSSTPLRSAQNDRHIIFYLRNISYFIKGDRKC